MERVCFSLQVKPEHLAEYKAAHAQVWPEMLHALAEAGWNNYSLFLRDDGLLIGYTEVASLEAARAAMARTDVNRRWQDSMAPYFDGLGEADPDTGFTRLEEIFHLTDQLAAAGPAEESGHDETRDER